MILATVLVALITLVWMIWFAPAPPQPAGGPATAADSQQVDTAQAPDQAATASTQPQDAPAEGEATAAETPPAPPTDSTLAAATQGTARTIVVENDVFTASFSTKGATLTSFTLNDYTQFDRKSPVQLVDTTGSGALALAFTTPQSRLVDTRSLYFSTDASQDTIRVTDEAVSVSFAAELGSGTLRQTYTFKPGSYDVGLSIQQENANAFTTSDGYELIWDGGLPFSEGGTSAEMQRTGALAYTGGDVVNVTVASEEHGEQRLNGDISWLAVKNKYFTAAILPANIDATRGADLIGDVTGTRGGSEAEWKNLVARLQMAPPAVGGRPDEFSLYLGPVYYSNLAQYDRDLYDMVDYGWNFFEWVTRPFAKYMFIPLFTFLHGFIPNYGIVIILLALFVKLLTYPLTKSSYRSMAQMRELQPKMQEIRDQYGDKPQKQQEEMMKLYKNAGANPLGGCLPMLLQYPVLIALYQFLPQSIQLRHESFLWANDLSVPDEILQLPIDIPVYGDYVAGFTALMGLAMVVQMRVQSTPSAGGQAKALMYMMPAFIFFIFNQFASALSLYYLVYNIVSAGQQQWINMQLDKEKDEDGNFISQNGNGQSDEKKGFLGRLIERANEAQKERR